MKLPDNILLPFEPISLKEMDNVKLLDRVDTKFMFHRKHLAAIFKEMQNDYRVLEIGGKRSSQYETLYFDTEGFELYLQHHNGRLNRYKFRSRRYVDSNLHFFEIKFKNNKGRTIKERIKRPEMVYEITGKASDFVKVVSPLDPLTLRPKLWVNYTRITFVNKQSQERLTVDTLLSFKNELRTNAYENLVIAEVKQGSSRDKSPFIRLMKKYSIAQKSISKYCLGVITLHPEIKRNRFKPTLLYLDKLL